MDNNTNILIKECAEFWAENASDTIKVSTGECYTNDYYAATKSKIKREISSYLEAQVYNSDSSVVLETELYPKGPLRLIQDNINLTGNIFSSNTITMITDGRLYIIQNNSKIII